MNAPRAAAVSPIHGLASPEELRAAINEDAGQCVHVLARWHLDEVLATLAVDGPKPLFVVALREAEFPLEVSWTVHRIADREGLAREFDLELFFPEHPRSLLADLFKPPPGAIGVIHLDLVFERTTGLEKYGLFWIPAALLQSRAAEHAGRSEAEIAWDPALAHHAWASRL